MKLKILFGLLIFSVILVSGCTEYLGGKSIPSSVAANVKETSQSSGSCTYETAQGKISDIVTTSEYECKEVCKYYGFEYDATSFGSGFSKYYSCTCWSCTKVPKCTFSTAAQITSGTEAGFSAMECAEECASKGMLSRPRYVPMAGAYNCFCYGCNTPSLRSNVSSLRSNVYTEDDVNSAIAQGKTLKEESAFQSFLSDYRTMTSEGYYRIITSYYRAVDNVRDKIVNHEEVSESAVRRLLELNMIGVVVQFKAKETYSSYAAPNITVLIKDGDTIYEALSPTIKYEIGDEQDILTDTPWKTTITAWISNYEDYAKKTVELIFIDESGKERKYSVDMSKFK